MRTNFLQIGKTGTCAVRAGMNRHIIKAGIAVRSHDFKAYHVRNGEPFFFTVRDPATRFVSAFNSRLRMGRPLNDLPHNPAEEVAFAEFPVPNALAEALSSEEPARCRRARFAMRGIAHVFTHQHHWFPAPAVEFLKENASRVVWVGFTETLNEDFARLKRLFNLPEECELPHDPVLAHRTPEGFATDLSDLAISNLRRWYAEDLRLVEWLRTRQF